MPEAPRTPIQFKNLYKKMYVAIEHLQKTIIQKILLDIKIDLVEI